MDGMPITNKHRTFEISGSSNRTVTDGSKSWITDKSGNAISQKYDKIWGFENGIAVFRKGDKYGIVNSDGFEILAKRYDNAAIDGDIIRICENNKWGFANSKGEVILEPSYYFFEKFTGQYARFEETYGYWGVLDKKGQIVIPPNYDYMGALDGSVIPVRNRVKYGAIDIEGRVVIPFVYDRIGFSGISGETTILIRGDEKIYI